MLHSVSGKVERTPMIEARAPTDAVRRAYNLYSYFYSALIEPLERKQRRLGLDRARILPHDKVLEVAVVGVPDRVMGEAVKVCVALRPGDRATAEEIKQRCADRLADYKVPKYVEFVESLPRNPAGKVSKAELRYVPGDEPKTS